MISVFIPTYNCSDSIEETLRSVTSQNVTDIEILCVDDGSTDSTPDILRRMSAEDRRIKPYFKKNQGAVPYSWIYVFPKLTGEYTLYMSHDDILAPGALQKMTATASSDSDIDCVIPTVRFFRTDIAAEEPDFKEINNRYQLGARQPISGEEAFVEMLDYSIPGFALWRTDLIRNIGMRTASFNSDELMQRLWIRQCRKVAFSDAVFGYRQVRGSIVSGLKPAHLFSLDTNLCLFEEINRSSIIPQSRKKELTFRYFKTTIYLSRCFKSLGQNLSTPERERALDLIWRSYDSYRHNYDAPFTLKNMLYRIMSLSPRIAGIRRPQQQTAHRK